MASKHITQETFDAAVRENIEEFEMGPEEAVKEAVEQFESQGNVAWLCPSAGSTVCLTVPSGPWLLTCKSAVLLWLSLTWCGSPGSLYLSAHCSRQAGHLLPLCRHPPSTCLDLTQTFTGLDPSRWVSF